MTDHSIPGKVALIAGGAKNLGGLIARDLAQQGATAVAIHYNSDASRADAEKTVAAIRDAGARAVALQGDREFERHRPLACGARLERHVVLLQAVAHARHRIVDDEAKRHGVSHVGRLG